MRDVKEMGDESAIPSNTQFQEMYGPNQCLVSDNVSLQMTFISNDVSPQMTFISNDVSPQMTFSIHIIKCFPL